MVSFQYIFEVRGVAQFVNSIQGGFSLSVCVVVWFWSGVSMEEYESQQSDDFCMGRLMIPTIKLR